MRHILLFLVLLATLMPGVTSGQQYHFKQYSVGEGLPQSQVFAMVEDSRGYIWMGTRGGGLCSYDGIEFKTYTVREGLPSNYIVSLHEDKNHILWIGTSGGLCSFNGFTFTHHQIGTSPPYVIGGIEEDDQGILWVGTDKGVFRWQKGSFERYENEKLDPRANISFIFTDSRGDLWIGGNKGLLVIKENQTVAYTTDNGLPTNLITSIGEDHSGKIWIGTYGIGLYLKEDSVFHDMNTLMELEKTVVLSIFPDSKNQLWFSTSNKGICKWSTEDSTKVILTEQDGLSNNHVRIVMEDRWGNFWIGTSGGGVNIYTGQQFEYYTKSNGLPGNYIYSLMSDYSGRLWIGASGNGVTVFDKNQFVHYHTDSGFMDVKVKTVYESFNCLKWFGTEGNGMYVYNGDTLINIGIEQGLGGNWVKDIEEDKEGNIWVGTVDGGITKVMSSDTNNFQFTYKRFKLSDGLSSNRISSIHLDTLGRLWYATQQQGIGYIEADTIFRHFNKNQGLAQNQVRSLTEDRYGNLWIACAGNGIDKLPLYADSMRFTNYDQESGLSSDNVYLLQFDRDENLWVGTEKGVDKITLGEGGAVLEATHFGLEDGFLGVETSQNASCLDDEGNVWFGTINGLLKYTTHENIENSQPPILTINTIRLSYVPIQQTAYSSFIGNWGSLVKELQLPFDENHITFEFLGILQTYPKKVKYKWKLEGLESTWSPPSRQRSITYSNLRPGQFTFQVIASNEDGIWNEKPTQVSFTILQPFWMKWWFIVTVTGVVLALIAGFIRMRLNTIKRKALATQSRLTIEKEMIRLEQKALRLQMNPHFIFNALNTIQSLIATKDEKSARHYLAKFSKLMRQILDNSRKSTITIGDEIDTLTNYLSIEKFCSGDHFDFEFNIDQGIEEEMIQIPPMIIQPFVENAIIHGVAGMKKGGRIRIAFRLEGEMLICTVEDNGMGRKKAFEQTGQKDQQHKSTALLVTQERLDLLNPESSGKGITITDLEKEDGTTTGTLVTINIPLL